MEEQELLDNLLLRLDSDRDAWQMVTAREVSTWPPQVFAALCHEGLLAETSPSTTYPCTDCDEDHDEEVVVIEEPSGSTPRMYISCPSVGRIRVNPEQLRQWRLVPDGFVQLTGRLLGISGTPRELIPGRVWRIGTGSLSGVLRDVILIRGYLWVDGPAVIDPVLNEAGKFGAVILIREGPNPPSCALPLSRVLCLGVGHFSLDRDTLELFVKAWPTVVPIPRSESDPIENKRMPAEDYVFKSSGDFWTLKYDGRESSVKNLLGMKYIAYILGHPNEDLPVFDFISLSKGEALSSSIFQNMSQTQLEREGMSIRSDLGDAGEMIDGQAKQQYRERLHEITEELEEAKEYGDIDRAERLEADKEALVHELSSALGLGGRNRKMGSTVERARVSVSSSIQRAIKKISEHDHKMAQYLDNSIRTGITCRYSPDKDISWIL